MSDSDLVEVRQTPKPVVNEIAGTGRDRDITRIQTFVDELIPPQDRVLWEQAGGDLQLYEKVAEDDQVKATMQQRISGLTSRELEIIPGDDRRVSIKLAAYVEENIKALDFDDICEKALYGVFYGYTLGEAMWAQDGTYTYLDPARGGVRIRNRRRFRFTSEMKPRLLTWENYLSGEDLPDRKFWYFCSGADNHDDPYGRGLASWLYWPVLFKRQGLKKWLTFLEKFAQPTVMGKYAPGTSESDQAKLLELTQAVASQTGIILPEGMFLELMEASRSGTADYTELHTKMNAAISKVVLSQTMTTDDGSSLSQAGIHYSVRQDVVKADADLIHGSFNKQIIVPLCDYNQENFKGAAYPKVWRRIEDEPDLKPQAERDKQLFDMGFRPTLEYIHENYSQGFVDTQAKVEDEAGQEEQPPLYAGLGVGGTQALIDFVNNTTLPQVKAIAVLVEVFGLTEEQAASMLKDDADEPEPEPVPPQLLPGQQQPALPAPTEQEDPALAAPPDVVQLFANRLQSQAAPHFGKWFERIDELLDSSEDMNDFKGKLDTAFPGLNGEPLVQLMSEAMMASRLAGNYIAQEEPDGD